MQARDGITNLAITCALVLIVALVAVVFRNRQPPVMTPRSGDPPPAVPVGMPSAVASGPALRKVEERFLSFPNAQVLDSLANEADTLRLKVAGEEHVFVLYFVDALDASRTHPERVAAQARYFGKASPDAVIETGAEARDYVLDLLKRRRFHLLTRWERLPNTDRYYALIMVENEPGKWVYLADLLVRQGFARVEGVTTPLPDDKRDEESYLFDLKGHAEYARKKRLGIWAKVKG